MDFDWDSIFMSLFITAVHLIFLIIAIVFYFVEGRRGTRDASSRILGVSGLILVLSVITAVMARYFVEFPKVGGYDMSSDFNFYFTLFFAAAGFFVYICFLSTGEQFAREKEMSGSLFLKKRFSFKCVDWKWVILPLPFLFLWTFILFSFSQPEPSELMQATIPSQDTVLSWIYYFLSISIIAPLTEEILYRHYAMGLLYKCFGTKKWAIAINITLTSLFFAAAHLMNLDNYWLKILQVMPLAVVLGYVNHKRGVEHSILIHLFFNTLAIPLSVIIELFR
jgi:membrane protease YdiL (CAAX protease family)